MLLCLLSTLVLSAQPKEPKPLPSLAKEPSIDGALSDWASAFDVKMPESAEGSSSSISLKLAFRKDTLYLGLTVTDDKVIDADHLDVTLYFPDSGSLSKGAVFRFTNKGLVDSKADSAAPLWARAVVKSAMRSSATGMVLEAAIPARAFPRFPAVKPLMVHVCAEYADVDADGAEASLASSCPTGDMEPGPVRLPDDWRKALKVPASGAVEAIEPREHGWVGFSQLRFPSWGQGDAALTPESLTALMLADERIDPAQVALPLPAQLLLTDTQPLFTLLLGKNPFTKKEGCVDGAELRFALYLVNKATAVRVLEWPAANCRLGRAMRFELSPEGELSIGYTGGSTAHFTWSVDHFERSELGLLPRAREPLASRFPLTP